MDRDVALWLLALSSAPVLYLLSELALYVGDLWKRDIQPTMPNTGYKGFRRKAARHAIRWFWRQIFCVLFFTFMLGAFSAFMICTALSFKVGR